MTPQRLVVKLDDVARALQAGAKPVAVRIRKNLYQTAVRWSSGKLTVTDLRRLDHPYARRHGSPTRDPRKINVKTGRFRSSWRSAVHQDGDALSVSLRNVDPKMDQYLRPGTPAMFARPIEDAIMAGTVKNAEERVKELLEQALGKLR